MCGVAIACKISACTTCTTIPQSTPATAGDLAPDTCADKRFLSIYRHPHGSSLPKFVVVEPRLRKEGYIVPSRHADRPTNELERKQKPCTVVQRVTWLRWPVSPLSEAMYARALTLNAPMKCARIMKRRRPKTGRIVEMWTEPGEKHQSTHSRGWRQISMQLMF